jgi:hypothetical protein
MKKTAIIIAIAAGAFAIASGAAFAQVSGNAGVNSNTSIGATGPAANGSANTGVNAKVKAGGANAGVNSKTSTNAKLKHNKGQTTGSAGSSSKSGVGVDKN